MLPKIFADQLRQSIIRNDYKAIFRGLTEWAESNGLSDIRDLMLAIQGQYEDLKHREMMGIIRFDDANIVINTLRSNLISLVSRLEKGENSLKDLSFNFGPGGTTINITQIHHGSGDNVAGDKTEHNG